MTTPGEAVPVSVRPVESARDQVANQLREMVLRGQLVAGDRLPSQAELAEQFGVSRSTLREAIQILTTEGLLTTTRGAKGGTSINTPEKHRVVEFLTSTLALLTGSAGMTVAELFEAREVLEVEAARRAATRRTVEEMERLRATVAFSDDIDSLEQYEMNRQFHELVVVLARNRFLHLVTEPVYLTLQNQVVRDRAPEDFWKTVHEDHLGIVEAIERGDSDEAATQMRDHLRRLRPSYEEALRADGRSTSD